MYQETKHIWIVNFYTAPPEYDTHLRHRKFANYLIDCGYEVTIISSSFLHGKNIDLIKNGEKYVEFENEGVKYIHIKTKPYVGNGLTRMFSIFLFTLRLYLLKNKFKRPDVVVHNAHVPFDTLVSRCARKLKAKYIVEAWDLWPESFVAFGLIGKNNPFLKIAYYMEKRLYACADSIIFSMEGGKDYIVEKKWDKEQGGPVDLSKVFYINNGVDLSEFEYNKMNYTIEDEDLENQDYFKIIYLGSIRLVNNVQLLIDAAVHLRSCKNIKFLIYGDGDERERLEKYCLDNNLKTVIFKQKWVPLRNVPYILSRSSLNILNYKTNSVDRFGGSQGKLFQYMASGKPICSNQVMGYDPIIKYNIGIAKNFSSAKDYADAIKEIYELPEDEYGKRCQAALDAAKEYDYGILSGRFLQVVEHVLNK